MISPPSQDDERLPDLMKEVEAADAGNSEAFDKTILTLSSGALALSLVFTKDIVTPSTAVLNPLLYASWVFFILSLGMNVAAYMRAFHHSRRLRRLLFDALRHRTEPEDRVQPLMDKYLNEVYLMHHCQGALFLIGAAVFTLYVMLNFHHEAIMTTPKNPPVNIERARPSASFMPSSVALDAQPTASFMPMAAPKGQGAATQAVAAAAAPGPAAPASSPQSGQAAKSK
jgi:hypothetical protein